MDLLALWHVVVKRWKLFVIFPILAVLLTFIYFNFVMPLTVTPQYSASTTLMIMRHSGTGQISTGDISLARQLVPTYREIVHSRRVMDLTIASMNLPISADALRGKVDVAAVRDTEMIIISAVDPDPAMARDIANEVARAFMNQIVEIMQIGNISVIDTAVTPNRPVGRLGTRQGVAMAFALGLMASFGLAFLLEYIDRTIKDPEQVQSLLNLPVIGVIPTSKEGNQLFTFDNPRSTTSEAFRTMRTNIQYSGVDRSMQVIMVCGVNAACGKSTVTANLALTFAQTGSSVLIVDSDMRRPTQHHIFHVTNEVGLSSLIVRDDLIPNDVIIRTEHENLNLLTCGPTPPYPAELLGSKKMKEMVASMAESFDYIIFDSPPIIAVTDAAVLSRLTDGAVFVIDYGKVKREEALAGLDRMQKVGAHMIGTVLNKLPQSSSYYDYYYYYSSDDSQTG